MTKEEQRFTAAVAAMQALCTSEIPEEVAMRAITIADALIKELDKHNPSYIDVINAAIKHVEDMGFKTNRFVNIVKIDKNNRLGRESFYYECYQCTQEGCDNDRISESHNYCHNCGSKIKWAIEENEPLPPYEKDLFANSKNGDGKKITAIDLPYIESFPYQNRNSKTYDVIVADTVVTKPNPDAKVVTKTQIATQNRNSIRDTPD